MEEYGVVVVVFVLDVVSAGSDVGKMAFVLGVFVLLLGISSETSFRKILKLVELEFGELVLVELRTLVVFNLELDSDNVLSLFIMSLVEICRSKSIALVSLNCFFELLGLTVSLFAW